MCATFDRTYEGLKRVRALRKPVTILTFDRTYEGLKRVEAIRPDHVVEAAFDRTYEGLKLLPRQALQQGVHVF